MARGLIISFCAIAVAITGTRAADCDMTTFFTCQTNLNQALSISDNQPWYNPEVFRKEVEAYYQKQGPEGIRKVCKAFREFKKCMGNQYAQCMSPVHFVSVSASTLNSYQFVGLFNQMHFVCGAGLQIYLANENCLSTSWKGESGRILNECRETFEEIGDENSQIACTAANNYLTCMERHVKSNCGDKSNDAQFWACEYSRVNVFTRFPQCPIRCVLPYMGGI